MYCNLRCLSHFSRFESVITIKDLVKYCKELGLDNAVLCDRMNIFGAVEFTTECLKYGIKPILGSILNTYLGECCVFVQNHNGYINLSNILSQAHVYYNGVVSQVLLEKYNSDLICIGQQEELYKIFGDRFYFEFYNQNHISHKQKWIIDNNIPIVFARNVNYLKSENKDAFDIFKSIGNINLNYEYSKFILPNDNIIDIKEAINNSFNITRRCSFILESSETHFPIFTNERNVDNVKYLRQITLEKLQNKIPTNHEQYNEYLTRLNMELNVICNKGFASYFLVTEDFVQYAREQNIPVGPGRGSGAGSLVAYCLGITNVDPLKFKLIFERFLNPERASNPDFDIDFCPEKRKDVIDYVRNKYGNSQVSYIITFGTLQARGVLKDVGRVLGMPHGKIDSICKLIPFDQVNPVTLKQAVEQVDSLKKIANKDENKRLFEISLQLEGLCRNYSKHAAGIIISDKAISNYCPLYLDDKNDTVTQFNMKFIEYIGLIKFDFLGLRNLTIINNTVKLIYRRYKININIDNIKLDDPKTFQLFQAGNLEGIFQFEGKGVKEVMKTLKPTNIEDLIATNALYRPGPIKHIPTYINRKHKLEQVTFPHPKTESILQNTYGVIIYQEQVMDLAVKLAGYTLSEADNLRRAMGKKKAELMELEKSKFLEGCAKNNIPENIANGIFKDMEEFAGYAFNRAHAVSYAIIGYQCAYLKANYMKEYLVSIINEEKDNKEKIVSYIYNLKENNIDILPPNVNKSNGLFIIENNSIRYGLVGIKGIGDLLIESIEKNKPYGSIEDFINKNFHLLNKKNWQSIVYSGMLDEFSSNRADVLLRLQDSDLLTHSSITHWGHMEKLKKQQEVMGFFLEQPILHFEKKYNMKFDHIRDYLAHKKINGLFCVEVLSFIRRKRNDNQFAFLKLIDHSGILELTISNHTLITYEHLLQEKNVIIVKLNSSYYNRTKHNIVEIIDYQLFFRDKTIETKILIHIKNKNEIKKLKSLLEKQQIINSLSDKKNYKLYLKIHNDIFNTNTYICPHELRNNFIQFKKIY